MLGKRVAKYRCIQPMVGVPTFVLGQVIELERRVGDGYVRTGVLELVGDDVEVGIPPVTMRRCELCADPAMEPYLFCWGHLQLARTPR
jgi:hypothetical protein